MNFGILTTTQINWNGNNVLQTKYYDFMHEKGFVKGEANNKPKDAREKTSGLVDIGLIDDIRYQHLLQKEVLIYREIERVSHVNIGAGPKTQKLLEACGSTPLKTAATLAELIRRPELNYKMLADIDEDRPELPDEVTDQVEISIKYDGYIKRQLSQVEKFKKLESKTLPEDICYSDIHGLRIEIKPVSIGQASRISGVTPADISVLLIHLSQGGQKQHMQNMHNDEKPENDTHETANRE